MPTPSNSGDGPRRGPRGQTLVEYTVLLSMGMGVVVGLWYLIGAQYHQSLFDFWADSLNQSVEVGVPPAEE